MTRQEILDEQLLSLTTELNRVLDTLPGKPDVAWSAKIRLLAEKTACSYIALGKPRAAWRLSGWAVSLLEDIQTGVFDVLEEE
jgi:hypothetical protein